MARILIVDDRDDVRRFLFKLLGCVAGHALVETADGADALAKAANHQPELVIGDLLMPAMDGLEFVRQLRSEPSLSHTAVIFYTAAFIQPEVKELAEACGAIYFVPRPCRPGAILRAVNEALNVPAPASSQPVTTAKPQAAAARAGGPR